MNFFSEHIPRRTILLFSFIMLFLFTGSILVPSYSYAGKFFGTYNTATDELDIQRSASGKAKVRLGQLPLMSVPGYPELPFEQLNIAIPSPMDTAFITIAEMDTVTLPGEYDIKRASHPLTNFGFDNYGIKESFRRESGDFSGEESGTQPFSVSSSDSAGPAKFPIEITGSWDYGGQNFITLTVHPLYFNERTGRLTLIKKLSYQLTWKEPDHTETTGCNFSPFSRKLVSSMLRAGVVNPEEIILPGFEGAPMGSILGEGSFDHVIITPAFLEDSWQNLVDWHLAKGVKDTVVTLEWIESTYSGKTTEEKIRAFSRGAHNNWGVLWILLGGDTTLIPCHWYRYLGRNIPGDSFYSDFDDDWVNEIFIGRASVNNFTDVENFIGRILVYEKNPPSDFATTALLMGFDLDGETHSEEMMEDFRTGLFPWYFGVAHVYDSDGGNPKENAIQWLNAGPNIIVHSDYAYPYQLGVGVLHYDATLDKEDIDGLSNGASLGNFYSSGSFSNAFHYDNSSFSEEYLSAETGGGVTFIGNSGYAWYTRGSTQNYSFLYNRNFMNALLGEGLKNIGAAFTWSKNSFYPVDAYYRYLWSGLNMLGEPELPVWMNEPGNGVVGYMEEIHSGQKNFTVRIVREGIPVENALVCVRKKEDGIYLANTTDSTGSVTFGFQVNPGNMDLTVSEGDLLPSESIVRVTGEPTLKKGPYSFYPGDPSTMAIGWQLDTTGDCILQWGSDSTCTEGWAQTSEIDSRHRHGRILDGLTPDTFYYYKITDPFMNVFRGSFRTAPMDNDSDVRIIAYGDTRTQPEFHDLVCKAILDEYSKAKDIPNLVIHTGDWVASDTISAWDDFFNIDGKNIRRLQASLPVNGTRGNHDGNGYWYSVFWPYPYEDDFYWSFDFGPVHVAIVDQYSDFSPGSTQFKWLLNDLESSDKPWKIMVYHEPAWSAGGGHGNNYEAQQYLQPLCKLFDVPVVIAGHNHYYARCVVDGIQHVTTAGGGAPLYGCDPSSPFLVSWARTYHYVILDINANSLSMKAMDIDGSVIDSFTIEK